MLMTDIKPGKQAVITDLTKLDKLAHKRLLDLGVYEGETIRLLASFPFGGPYLFEVSGQRIGIRRFDAGRIGVEG
ncbi:ferrous iron transport protein A [Sporolactobacillus sp. THM7-4]|nr:ferrous iron transport protein A [Sporolactobacillus sp. THM7-4]